MNRSIPILLLFCLIHSSTSSLSSADKHKHPHFDEQDDSDKTTQVLIGGTANLTCGVKDLGDYEVVWIRTRDLHILSTGRIFLTKDQRFSFADPKLRTILQISNVKASDETDYECKITTDPPISERYPLQVLPPSTKIITPEKDLYNATHLSVPRGSRLNLTCEIVALEELQNLTWIQSTLWWSYDDQRLLEVVKERENETSFTQGLSSPILSAALFQMVLIVENVDDKDGGEYYCRPEGLPWANITVVIVEPGTVSGTTEHSMTTTPDESGEGAGQNMWSHTWDKMLKTQEQILQFVKQIANHITGRKD